MKKYFKDDIYNLLSSAEIDFDAVEHRAIFNMKEAEEIDLPHKDAEAKNLLLCDDKKNYYLVTVKGDKRIDMKKLRTSLSARRLQFASEEELYLLTSLTRGAVTPLGVLNDEERKVIVILDKAFLSDNGLIGIHPNDNTATIFLDVNDLIKIIKTHGNEARIIEL